MDLQYLLYTLDYNPILLYSNAWALPSFTTSPSFHLFLVPLTYPSLWDFFFSIIFSFLLYFLGISLLSSTTDQFSSIQSLSPVQIFATPWTAACQASLSINNCQSLTKLMSIESVMPSSHLILCYPLLLLPSISPSIRAFSMSKLFAWGGQSIGVSAFASVLPMNTQDWSSLEWTGWISLQSKGLSRVFSNTTVQKH